MAMLDTVLSPLFIDKFITGVGSEVVVHIFRNNSERYFMLAANLPNTMNIVSVAVVVLPDFIVWHLTVVPFTGFMMDKRVLAKLEFLCGFSITF